MHDPSFSVTQLTNCLGSPSANTPTLFRGLDLLLDTCGVSASPDARCAVFGRLISPNNFPKYRIHLIQKEVEKVGGERRWEQGGRSEYTLLLPTMKSTLHVSYVEPSAQACHANP